MRPLQFVILRHEEVAEPHFDLMFETLPGSGLATWRSPVWPIEETIELVRLKEHRRAFLDFQGELTGHRGRVYPLARGTCEVTIGENAIWTIRLLSGTPPGGLVLRPVNAERWEGSPA